MPLKPAVGSPGGQRYDVARAIRTFLEQMASGEGFSFGGAVIKELIQNADDAGASELVVALDERFICRDRNFHLRGSTGKENL